MGANEIWRIDPDGGGPERVAGDLGVPDAVKFDAKGYIVSTQVQRPGAAHRSAHRRPDRAGQLDPGLDNLTFVGDRLFVSNSPADHRDPRRRQDPNLLPGGFNWPLDLAMGDDGRLYVADGTSFYALRPRGAADRRDDVQPRLSGLPPRCGARGARRVRRHHLGRPGCALPPGDGETEYSQTGSTSSTAWRRARRRPSWSRSRHGARVSPVRQGRGAGRRTAGSPRAWRSAPTALPGPEPGAGGWSVTGAGTETVLDGLQRPQGILVRDGLLYIVDAGAKEVIAFDLDSRPARTIAAGLPVGAPPGVNPKPLRGMPPFSGPRARLRASPPARTARSTFGRRRRQRVALRKL